MPRANRYHLPGHTYHLTHRCHDRQFLLRHAVDRDAYRSVLWETLQDTPVWLLSYCITCNHAHWLARSEDSQGISFWMQRAEGQFAQYYNRRKGRSGGFWEGRYHSTLVDGGEHLERCMTYIELNMVRAGVVDHPKDWPWCSYQEWAGKRVRYRLVDLRRGLDFLGGHGISEFRRNFESRIDRALAAGKMEREPRWTEGVAVGSASFVEEVAAMTRIRRNLEREEVSPGAWVLREDTRPKPWQMT